jgi:hypothetical protein
VLDHVVTSVLAPPFSRPALLLVACCLLLLPLACGGGSSATPQPTLSPPPLDPRLVSLAQGTLALDVVAGGRQQIDPLALARQAVATPPTCAQFVFLFNWRTDTSGGVAFTGNRMGGVFDIAAGASGQASVSGCLLIEATSPSGVAVSGDLRYIIAEARP